MNLPPLPSSTSGIPATPSPTRRGGPAPAAASFAATLADSAVSVSVQTTAASPPAEVLAAMSTASDAYDRLAASGRSVSFSVDPASGRVSAALTDASGNHLAALSGEQVLSIASGESAS